MNLLFRKLKTEKISEDLYFMVLRPYQLFGFPSFKILMSSTACPHKQTLYASEKWQMSSVNRRPVPPSPTLLKQLQ